MPIVHRSCLMAGILTAAALAAAGARLAAPVHGEPPSGTPSPGERAHADLHARYAAARLRLAEANLARAEHLAGSVAGQVNEQDLASLRRRVDVLRQHVATTRERPHENSFQLSQAAAEMAVRQAEQERAAAQAVKARQPGAVSPDEERQLDAAVDLAKVRLEIWNDPAFLDAPLQVMQMQIDQLADDVFELRQRSDTRFLQDRR